MLAVAAVASVLALAALASLARMLAVAAVASVLALAALASFARMLAVCTNQENHSNYGTPSNVQDGECFVVLHIGYSHLFLMPCLCPCLSPFLII